MRMTRLYIHSARTQPQFTSIGYTATITLICRRFHVCITKNQMCILSHTGTMRKGIEHWSLMRARRLFCGHNLFLMYGVQSNDFLENDCDLASFAWFKLNNFSLGSYFLLFQLSWIINFAHFWGKKKIWWKLPRLCIKSESFYSLWVWFVRCASV